MIKKQTIDLKTIKNKPISLAYESKLTIYGDFASAVTYYSYKIPPESLWRAVYKNEQLAKEVESLGYNLKNLYYRVNPLDKAFIDLKIITRNKMKNKLEQIAKVRKQLAKHSKKISANFTRKDAKAGRVRFLTLTYAENMKDTKKLYRDYDIFLKKLKYHFLTVEGIDFKSCITAKADEPQERGAWHIHLLIKAPKRIFLDNKIIAEKWGHGFTKTESLASCKNVGAYITTYLTNLIVKIKPCTNYKYIFEKKVFKAKGLNKDFKKFKSKVLNKKGKRLALYPPHKKIISFSRNAKNPEQIIDYHKNNLDFIEAEGYKLQENEKQKGYKIVSVNAKGQKTIKKFYYENYAKKED